MATTANWYHAHQDSVKRSDGKSSVGLIAYITGETLKDERTGTWCSRNHPGEVLAWGTVAPDWAPDHLTDDAQLSKAWNDVERSETRKNSIVAVHWNVAGSREFSDDDHKAVARGIASQIMQRYGVMVTYGIHKPTDHGDDRNWHYHFGHNMRRVTKEGFGEKAREIIDQKTFVDETRQIRSVIADIINQRLDAIGSSERVTHLSYAERGFVQEPTLHLGNKQNQAELKGQPTPTGDENRAIRDRNQAYQLEQIERHEAKNQLEAEIHDLVVARLKQMKQGTRPVEVSDQQFTQRDDQITNLLDQVGKQRQSLQQFDQQYEEDQKRIARLSTSREEETEIRRNRGDIPDAEDRWASAMHKAYNPRVKPEESMAMAVGYEAEQFRREQKESREAEEREADPAKKKLLEYNRQIAACDYMALGADRCAAISGFIIGRKDNEISNRDRERAVEWREIGEKLRADRVELRETINKNIHEEIEAFLKAPARGQQPPTRREQTEPEKEKLYGISDRPTPTMGLDLPPGQQPAPHEHNPQSDIALSYVILPPIRRKIDDEPKPEQERQEDDESLVRRNAKREVTNSREEWQPPEITDEKAAKIDARSQKFNEEDSQREEMPEQQRYGGISR